MATTVIIGNGGHHSIHRMTVALASGSVTLQQKEQYERLLEKLKELANQVNPE